MYHLYRHLTVAGLALAIAGLAVGTATKAQTTSGVTCPALIKEGSNLIHEIASLPVPPTCNHFVDKQNHHAFSYEVEGQMRLDPEEYIRVVVWKTDGKLKDWDGAQVEKIFSAGKLRPFDMTLPLQYGGKRVEANAYEFDQPNEDKGNSCLVTDLQEQPDTQTRIVVCRQVKRHAPDNEQWWTALQIARDDVPFIQGPAQIAY
ncbi:MAG TPA: hypothetical protein VM659_08710 [Dongiaceae bacterium]|nr:hypothetical protein [Dongiaceae bacterium]